jgi:hypothetical protein
VVTIKRVDHDNDAHEDTTLLQTMNTSCEHALSGQVAILFGHTAARAFTASGSDNDSSDLHLQASWIAAAQHTR